MSYVDEGVRALKNEFRNYNHYHKQLDRVTEELDEAWYQLSGVKAADPSKIPVRTYNASYSEQMRLESLEKIEELEKRKNRLQSQIDYLDSVLSSIDEDIVGPIICIYIQKHTYFYAESLYEMSASYLQYRIDKNLREIIKKGG